jgi:hypothetical protein
MAMIRITDINKIIGSYLYDDPQTLINMGEVSVLFRADCADQLVEAIEYCKRKKVMEELYDYVRGQPPTISNMLAQQMCTPGMVVVSSRGQDAIRVFLAKYKLWEFVRYVYLKRIVEI